MVSETKVTIKNLYKIFGKDPAGMISHVQNGTTKQELLEKYGSVLALNECEHRYSCQGYPGHYGTVWIWKIDTHTPRQQAH